MSYRDYINKVGYSIHKCVVCQKLVTNPSYFYSMKKFNEPHCYTCGRMKESSATGVGISPAAQSPTSVGDDNSPRGPQ